MTDERAVDASSGGAYAAITNPPARAPTGSAASGNVRCRRRPSSSGVSPGRRSAPARLASVTIRFQTVITLRGRRYREAATRRSSTSTTTKPTILVSVAPLRFNGTVPERLNVP